MGSWMRNSVAAVGLITASTLLAVLAAEGLARWSLDPADFLHATLVDDPVLGHRIEPGTTGHDRLGFRNREAPAQVDIVAIGDSVTYGVSAPRDGSWPHQLAGLLGEPVYNMGLGGYGPLQYLHLTRSTAAALRPRQLLVGLYFGNDLMDAHLVAQAREAWKPWRLAEPVAAATDSAPAAELPRKRFEGLRNWLSRHSMLYSVLRATVLPRLAAQEREAQVRAAAPDELWPWSDPAPGAAVRTVFTPQGRLAAVDAGLPAVREGLDITKNALAALQDEAARQQIGLLVLMIPTKERAYCGYLTEVQAQRPPSFVSLCAAEDASRAEIAAFLDQRGLARVDVLPALEAAIARHEPLYPPDADGHPQSSGYGVIAQAVAAALRPAAARP